MSVSDLPKQEISAAEQFARVDCAAVYRLLALYGMDDVIFTHVSMRVPGERDQFLISPFGLMFEEVTASSLIKINSHGDVLSPTDQTFNTGAFVIHSAIHSARSNAHCIVHLHTTAGIAVSALEQGLMPLTQTALTILPTLAYHDFEGPTVNLGERARIVADLGDKTLMFLRNHGTLSLGASAAEAFLGIYSLERACQQQLAALSMASPLRLPAAAVQTAMAAQSGRQVDAALRAWPALMRKLDRLMPGYDR